MAAQVGLRNLITDVPGILVGQAEDHAGISGTTVVLAEAPAAASVDVRGGAPGSRETELLAPGTLVERIDAIVLSGGSAFGLDAAAGVMDWLAEAGRGFTVGSAIVPIVPAAILFDLGFPGRRAWTGEPPYRALGSQAVATAAKEFALGNAGAGLGATAGQLKGGVGSASLALANGAMAIMAQDGLARAIRPVHTPFDGDTVFALSTGRGSPAEPAALARLGSAAADCLSRAIMRAVLAAEPLGDIPNWRKLWGSGA